MPNYLDAENVSLGDAKKRIEESDLVPSRAPLVDGIGKKIKALEGRGIATLARLREELKTAKRMEALARDTGIGPPYLALLRREIESWFPKPFPLKDFNWFPKVEISKLEKAGIRDSASLHEAAGSARIRAALAKSARTAPGFLEALSRCADLTRVQWVSPTAARMLMETGCDSAAKLAASDAEKLCDALERVNSGGRFFKGKIGLRDVKRIIRAAGYIAN
jgi:predicted flap endonuclease-1-like 5' DNA nuclease